MSSHNPCLPVLSNSCMDSTRILSEEPLLSFTAEFGEYIYFDGCAVKALQLAEKYKNFEVHYRLCPTLAPTL